MWEAIERNRRRSWILIGIMGVILIGLGALAGMTFWPDVGVFVGAAIAAGLWTVLMLVTFLQGERLVLLTASGRRIRKEDYPRLFNVVEEMAIASGLPKPPDIYVIEDETPNAFAAGRNPDTAVVAVTSGLLTRLNRDELQGVMAHEIAHIKNLDVRFMTVASVMVGSIVILSQMYLRVMFFSGGRRRTGKGGGGHPAFIILAIVAAILAPVVARVLYFACSRRREYLADACAARFTRYPPGLASALEKIAMRHVRSKDVNKALAPMYIVNPLQSMSAVGLFSTHPPTGERIKILRSMGGKAGYVDYEAAYRRIHGKKSRCMGMRTLSSEDARSVDAREGSAEPDSKKDAIERVQEVTDLLGRMAELLLITCVCGVKIKVPDEYKKSEVPCPRCGRKNALPRAVAASAPLRAAGVSKHPSVAAAEEALAASVVAGAAAEATHDPVLRFERKGKGWESFRCTCDRVIQISPGFQGTTMKCTRCKREIEFTDADTDSASETEEATSDRTTAT